MNQRYFRSDAATYEAIRAGLDAEWGHSPGTGTAVLSEFCEYEAVAAVLPALLSSGAVEEIDQATYQAAMPVAMGE